MRAVSSRVWVVGGVVAGLLLVLATYLLAIAPARTEAATVRSQVEDAAVSQAALRQRLRALEAAAADVTGLQATASAAAASLPATPDTQGVVRRVQAAAAAHRSAVASVAIGDGTTTDVAGVWALPVTAQVTGAEADLVAVLADLTAPTGRVLSVRGATVASEASGTSITLDLVVYCTTDPALAPVDPTADPAAGAAGGTTAGVPAAGGAAPTETATTAAS